MSFLCSLPLAARLLSVCAAPAALATGYVEGDYVLLAPIEVAQVQAVNVQRGDRVSPGTKLVQLETTDAEIAVHEASAALAQAKAQLANLQVGKRPQEIAVLEATVRSAKAQANEAQRVLERTNDLHRRGIATQAQLDEATTAMEVADAAIGQSEANLAVAALPGRMEEIEAARSAVKQAQAALEHAQWRLSRRLLEAPAPGRVTDIIRNAGDMAGPTAPVISILPDGAVKLTVFIPQEAFASVEVGSKLAVHCDGCGPDLRARVSYVSTEPEFTPPVIYSIENRQKLVYLVEARPEGDATMLKPGQIVDVALIASEAR